MSSLAGNKAVDFALLLNIGDNARRIEKSGR
jgi:hypothetical protein